MDFEVYLKEALDKDEKLLKEYEALGDEYREIEETIKKGIKDGVQEV